MTFEYTCHNHSQNPATRLTNITSSILFIIMDYWSVSWTPTLSLGYFAFTFNHAHCVEFCLQHPPTDRGNDGGFHWAISKISNSEKYFLSQLISSSSKDVSSPHMLATLQFSITSFSFLTTGCYVLFLQLFKKTAPQVLQMDISSLPVMSFSLFISFAVRILSCFID